MRFLVIEDNNTDYVLLQGMLERIKVFSSEIVRAESLTAGLERLDHGGFDAVFLDLGMPECWGIETFNRAREKIANIPLIILTNLDDTDVAIQAARSGAEDYLVKSQVNINDLRRSVLYAIERKQRRELTRLELELTSAFGNARGFDSVIRLALDTLLSVKSIDGGAIYQFQEREKAWTVLAEKRWSPALDARVRSLLDTPEPRYFKAETEGPDSQETLSDALALLPLRGKNGAKAALCLFSRTVHDYQANVREFLESVAVRMGDAISRVIAEEALRELNDTLERKVEERVRELTREILAREKAETEARLRKEQLLQADKMASLGILVAGVAHEINNPNNCIMLNTPLLKRFWETVQPLLDRYVEDKDALIVNGIPYSELEKELPLLFEGIQESAKRIRDIVTGLKDYARKDPGSREDRVDLNLAVKAAMTLLSNMLKHATAALRVDLAPDLPPLIGSAQKIEQVVINLIQNACQALTDANQAIAVQTTYDAKSDRVSLIVKDEGAGISEKDLPYITDPFFTTKRDKGGTGLGLSISAGIIQDHGGDLRIESAEDNGTTVTVTFPAGSRSTR